MEDEEGRERKGGGWEVGQRRRARGSKNRKNQTGKNLTGKKNSLFYLTKKNLEQKSNNIPGHDYVAIMEFLMKHWDIETMTNLTPEAQKAQEEVCVLLGKLRKLTSIQDRRLKTRPSVNTKFSWIFNREIPVIQV